MISFDDLIKSLSKWQIKLLLSTFALIIIVSIVIYTQLIVNDLIDREKRIIKSYSNIFLNIINNDQNVEASFFFLKEIAPNITFPMISTDDKDEPNYPFEDWSRNIPIDKKMSTKEQREYMTDYVRQMKETYPPIILKDKNGKVIQKIYYTNSKFISFLKYFPVFAIGFIGGFIFVGYIAFSNIRRHEESKVWVGMAKEAAHQLGTPLSSMLAWMELLRVNREEAELFEQTIDEMHKDLERLNVITTRFSKIGSQPQLKSENISEILELTCIYFDKRLPHIGRKIQVIRDFEESVFANVNTDLFIWVIENLIKNAAEAIDTKYGEVTISLKEKPNSIIINVEDNGRGMTNKVKKQIFNPGFTTKRRGWGLGLSLCKRIIEQYHNGKIFVKESQINRGTIFEIQIPKEIKQVN